MIIIDKNAKREVQVKYPDRTRVLFPNLDDGYISSNDVVMPGVDAPISADGVGVASINDGAEGNAISKLVIGIEPVQDLHGQSNPYPAGGGVNQWDEEWENCSYGSSDGIKTTNASCVGNKNPVPVSASTAYYFKIAANSVDSNLVVYEYDASNVFLGRKFVTASSNNPLTTRANTKYINFYWVTSATTGTYNHDFSVNYPSTDHNYHPYSNICPISGHTSAVVTRTGFNVWDEEWENGSINDNTGENATGSGIRSTNYISVVPNATYYFYVGNGSAMRVFFYGKDKTYLSRIDTGSTTFTVPTNAYYMRFRSFNAYGTTYNHDISINYPSTDTAYHAYTGEEYEIDLDGTRYGGTLDVTTGVLTVDRAYVTLTGEESWSYSSGTKTFYASDVAPGIDRQAYANAFTGISNKFEAYPGSPIWSQITDKYYVGYLSDSNDGLRFSIPGHDTVDSTVTSLINGTTVCYKLATPTTIQLTPQEVTTLLGQNNIFADCGDILKLSYSANMNIRLQDLLDEKLDKPTTPGTLGQVLTSDGEGGQTWETPE